MVKHQTEQKGSEKTRPLTIPFLSPLNITHLEASLLQILMYLLSLFFQLEIKSKIHSSTLLPLSLPMFYRLCFYIITKANIIYVMMVTTYHQF